MLMWDLESLNAKLDFLKEYAKTACDRVLECGHLCGGVKNETKCLPCLHGCSDKLGTVLKQDGDDMCMICFTDALAFAPAILVSFALKIIVYSFIHSSSSQ